MESVSQVDSQNVGTVNNYAKYHEQFIPIKKMNRVVAFRNLGVH